MADPTGESTPHAAEILLAAVELPEDQRQSYLDSACAGSDELRREVESLLAAYASGRMPDAFDAQAAAGLMESEASGVEDWLTGPYRLVREIGRGGMGAVYLSERADGAFEQQVALKLIKRGMDSEAILERFLRERQILAGLEHPNIAHLLDGGVADDGRPYLVMEFVPGRTLLTYCEEEDVDLDGKMDLFAEVCRAVQHAHRNLVVHRDLKPSNVLVTREGRVKLLDFGVAKLLDESGDAMATALTQAGAGGLTPQYAAPEQVLGRAITTATDVYALGLMLYELLTGELPYQVEAGDAERVICETEPMPPSRALASKDAGARRVRRRLQGDLDTIVLKALRKEPERRYASAEAMLEDLKRHREGRPVEARPDTVGYRASRFVQRHKVGVAASTLVGLSLVIGLGVALWQARVATAALEQTRIEAEKLAASQEYLVSLFEAADPAEALGEEITAKQLVDRGVERLAELTGQPEVELEMLDALSRVAIALGDHERMEVLVERALLLARAQHGEQHVETAALLGRLGRIHMLRGDWERAETELRRALVIFGELGAEEQEPAVETLTQLGTVLHHRGDSEAAAETLEDAVSLARKVFGTRSHEVASALNNYSFPLEKMGRYDEGEAALREALSIQRELLGDEHPDIATAMINLGSALHKKGDPIGAEPYYREALAMEERLRGPDHPRYAIKLHNLAVLLHDLADYDGAAEAHRRVVELVRERMGVEHPYYGAALDSLAGDLAQAGRFDEAMELFGRAEPLLREAVGIEHEMYVLHRQRLGRALHRQDRSQDAVPLLDQAVGALEQLRGASHPQLASALADRGRIHLALGHVQRAETDLRRALEIQRQALPAPHHRAAATLTSLSSALLARGDVRAAEPLAREAVEMAAATLPTNHPTRREARDTLNAVQGTLRNSP